ncbi:hypothetical protein EVAR_48828_1 [Eumeta japonica]|uniref:Uncharacterized protein n=1 Tax=Eumeta variegata TaxID=151549 RepID=A0A4C1Y1T5_EUMVA|nr:hypothetical protein EVAR_48828_1 [Eumeta japonica]
MTQTTDGTIRVMLYIYYCVHTEANYPVEGHHILRANSKDAEQSSVSLVDGQDRCHLVIILDSGTNFHSNAKLMGLYVPNRGSAARHRQIYPRHFLAP